MRNVTRILLNHALGVPQKIEATNSEGYTNAEQARKDALTRRALELQLEISNLGKRMPDVKAE